jgi:hypothetical protein
MQRASWTWLLTALVLLLTANPAQAHALYVRYRVLQGNQVRIESFFQGGSPAVDGIVRVYRADGSLLHPPGVIDDKGFYLFFYKDAENLKVRVSCDEHAKEVSIPAVELINADPVTDVEPDRAEPSRLAEILAGLSLILALAAFYMSVKTAARLRTCMGQGALPARPITPAPEKLPRAPLPTGPGQD